MDIDTVMNTIGLNKKKSHSIGYDPTLFDWESDRIAVLTWPPSRSPASQARTAASSSASAFPPHGPFPTPTDIQKRLALLYTCMYQMGTFTHLRPRHRAEETATNGFNDRNEPLQEVVNHKHRDRTTRGGMKATTLRSIRKSDETAEKHISLDRDQTTLKNKSESSENAQTRTQACPRRNLIPSPAHFIHHPMFNGYEIRQGVGWSGWLLQE